MLYQRQGDFSIAKRSYIGFFSAGKCFGTSFDIIDPRKMDKVWCNLMSFGERNHSKISIWFQPGTTTIGIRLKVVSTHESKTKFLRGLYSLY